MNALELALALTVCAVLTSASVADAVDVAHTAEQRGVTCRRKHGHTILHHGTVRAFKSSGTVFGCVDGSTRAWPLWGSGHIPYEIESG
ncbi:MAG TPA: hypothetical protein VK701_04220 [Solirubrobacteraceae bacterium]|nr:hypothetical protein [Solirubrobacteraceae bacterium]